MIRTDSRRGVIAASFVAAILLPMPALACSACGCSLTSDWVGEGLHVQPGLRLDLRYDYLPQTQLRSGNHKVGPVALPAGREIEKSTYNHYGTIGLDYAASAVWGVTVQLPYILRPHDTYGEGETELTHSRTDGVGDLRVIGRFQGFGGSGITGVQLGLKLPTGGFHTRFDSGPEAGEFIDRGLQAGSGTTDLIAGAYHFGGLAAKLDWFASVQGQAALARRADYRPGNAALGSAGINYTGWGRIVPQLQFNLRVAEKDRGFNSDGENSGGELLYASPGIAVRIGSRATAFTHVQLPLYQHVNGYQLTPRATVSAGVQVRL